MRAIRGLLFVYFVVISWTNVFAISSVLPIHVLVGICIVLGFFIVGLQANVTLPLQVFDTSDAFLVAALLGLSIAGLAVPTAKSLNYVVGYGYTFVIGYIALKVIAVRSSAGELLLRGNAWGVGLTCVIAVIEFVVDLVVNVDIGMMLPHVADSTGTYGGFLPRSAAFANEPGVLAFYLETLGPIAIYYVYRQTSGKAVLLGYGALVLAGWSVTFSAGSVIALGAAAALIGTWEAFRRGARAIRRARLGGDVDLGARMVAGIGVVMVAAVVGLWVSGFGESLLARITFTEVGTVTRRVTRWRDGLAAVGANPVFGMGLGHGSLSAGVSYYSWYLTLAAEAGLFVAAAFAAFVAHNLVEMWRSAWSGSKALLLGALAGAIHLLGFSVFFHPFVWGAFVIFDVHRNDAYARGGTSRRLEG